MITIDGSYLEGVRIFNQRI